MSSPPTLPARQFSFTNHSVNFPSTPQPGDKLDLEFDNARLTITDIINRLNEIQRVDGALANASVGLAQLQPGVYTQIINAVTPSLGPQVTSANNAAAAALAYETQANTHATNAAASANSAAGSALSANVAANSAQSAAAMATAATAGINADATAASNSANHALQSERAAGMSEDMAYKWAEYISGPVEVVPPGSPGWNNAVDDGFWSAKWWALKAMHSFGAFAKFFLGAFPSAPGTMPDGTALIPGAIYYDTTSLRPLVWDGQGWRSFERPTPAAVENLIYRVTAVAGQSAFDTKVLDLNSANFTIDPADPEGVDVHVNGILLAPGIDYTVDVATSTVSFAAAVPQNAIVQIDVLQPRGKLASGGVKAWKILDIDLTPGTGVPGYQNGTRTIFPLKKAAGGVTIIPGQPEDLLISVDGVIQEPGVDYNVTGSNITFTVAPRADAKVFGTWFEGLSAAAAGPTYDYMPPPTFGQQIFSLSKVPANPLSVELHINGQSYFQPDFVLAGSTLTWTGLFTLVPSDQVVISYS